VVLRDGTGDTAIFAFLTGSIVGRVTISSESPFKFRVIGDSTFRVVSRVGTRDTVNPSMARDGISSLYRFRVIGDTTISTTSTTYRVG
jgi:hypothetical protein